MSFAHKLALFEEEFRKKIPYCVICGQEDDLNGPCIGPFVKAPDFEAQFKEIFDKPVPPLKKKKNFVSGLA